MPALQDKSRLKPNLKNRGGWRGVIELYIQGFGVACKNFKNFAVSIRLVEKFMEIYAIIGVTWQFGLKGKPAGG